MVVHEVSLKDVDLEASMSMATSPELSLTPAARLSMTAGKVARAGRRQWQAVKESERRKQSVAAVTGVAAVFVDVARANAVQSPHPNKLKARASTARSLGEGSVAQHPYPARAVPISYDPLAPQPEDARRLERWRDNVLRMLTLNTRILNTLQLIWAVLVVGVGAFFFFMMVGWHNITPESKANWWSNMSIQVLNWLFTYAAIISLPWRLANAQHLWCRCKTGRSNAKGLDFYGRESDGVWFHVSWGRRSVVIALALMNALCQYANQATATRHTLQPGGRPRAPAHHAVWTAFARSGHALSTGATRRRTRCRASCW